MKRIRLAGGGTGGHLMPGLALAAALRRQCPDADIAFIGTADGLETKLVPAAGYRLELTATGRGGLFSWRKPWNAPRFLWAVGQCLSRFRRERPDVLVALGGYAAAAPGVAARILGIPSVVLEQNVVPGRVNRRLGKWAREIHSQFAEAEAYFRATKGEFIFSGSPLRDEFVQLAGEHPVNGDAILVLGGSQGARRLNEMVICAATEIVTATGLPILHVAGDAHADTVRAEYAKQNVNAEVFGFCDDMAGLYQRSRLVIARSGATSLAEFAAAGLPAILVPLPTAKDDHQRKNAEAVTAAGAAVVIDETATSMHDLADAIWMVFDDPPRRVRMAAAMRSLCRPDAGDRIAERILRLVENSGKARKQ